MLSKEPQLRCKVAGEPDVIIVEESDKITSRHLHPPVAGRRDPNAAKTQIGDRKSADKIRGAIRRAVVDDDDFDVEVTFLHRQGALDGLGH
jgi:hypothetical protein